MGFLKHHNETLSNMPLSQVLDVVTVPFAGPTMHAATCSRELDITRGLFSSSAVQVQDQADGEVSRGAEVSVYAVEPR